MNSDDLTDKGLEKIIDDAYNEGWNAHKTGAKNSYDRDTQQSLYFAWEEGKEEAAKDAKQGEQ